mmetsp:Transcript_25622/g.84626  ORF Transcript_25622/g.84626 Transcript_25622/m.84626 type:complete len:246 (-) Transcript_25622:84-821(-)
MDSSMTSWTCSESADSVPAPTTCSWETLWTEEATAWRRSPCLHASLCDTLGGSSSFEATTSRGRSPRSTGSTRSASGSTGTRRSGNISPTSSTFCPSLLSSTSPYSVCMEAFPRPCGRSNKYHSSTGFRRSPVTAQRQICSGQTQTRIVKASTRPQEEQATPSAPMSCSNSCRRTASFTFSELTNSAWKATRSCLTTCCQPFGQRPTTATGAATWRRSSRSTRRLTFTSTSSALPPPGAATARTS